MAGIPRDSNGSELAPLGEASSTAAAPIDKLLAPNLYAPENFELSQRAAQSFAASSLVPQQFRNTANAMICLDMANRLRCSPLMVAQCLYIVQGKPSWSAQFVIAAINSCGRFTPLRFVMTGEGMERQCHCESTDLKTGENLTGPAVSMQMAKAEGWIDKSGSKWKTMPELMLRYRAGAFFGRLYAPDVLLGLYTQDEALDIVNVQDVSPKVATTDDDDFI
jgi:hypothetical protein